MTGAEHPKPETRPLKRAGRTITKSFVSPERAPILQVAKTGVAAILAWFACEALLPGHPPIFGTIAALLAVQESVRQSLTKGIERFAGVLIGVSVAVGAGVIFGAPSWLFIAAILVALVVGWSFRMTGPSTNQVAITALLVIALGGQDTDYALERIIETAIGAAIGIAVNAFIVAPVRTTPTNIAVTTLVDHTADALDRIAEALRTPKSRAEMEELYDRARELQSEREDVHAQVRRARESLQLNPRGRRHRQLLEEDDQLFQRAQRLVTQVIGMSRALFDGYDPALTEDRAVQGLSVEMARVAHDLRHIGYHFSEHGEREVEPPALTAPYRILTPNPDHWILIGSLMEDLRRVRLLVSELQDLVDEQRSSR